MRSLCWQGYRQSQKAAFASARSHVHRMSLHVYRDIQVRKVRGDITLRFFNMAFVEPLEPPYLTFPGARC